VGGRAYTLSEPLSEKQLQHPQDLKIKVGAPNESGQPAEITVNDQKLVLDTKPPVSVAQPPAVGGDHDHDAHSWWEHLKHFSLDAADIGHDASPFVLIPSAISLLLGLAAKAAGFGAQALSEEQKANIARLEAIG